MSYLATAGRGRLDLQISPDRTTQKGRDDYADDTPFEFWARACAFVTIRYDIGEEGKKLGRFFGGRGTDVTIPNARCKKIPTGG